MTGKDKKEILNIIQSKGWTLKSLGERWDGLSERQMSRIVDSSNIRDIDAVNGLPKRIELKVSHHPSGNSTLMFKSGKIFQDYKNNGLFCNNDLVSFYQSVELKIGELIKEGYSLDYQDSKVKYSNMKVVFSDDGISQITVLSKAVFVSAKMVSPNKIELILSQRIIPSQVKLAHHTYMINLEPHNLHLKECLNW